MICYCFSQILDSATCQNDSLTVALMQFCPTFCGQTCYLFCCHPSMVPSSGCRWRRQIGRVAAAVLKRSVRHLTRGGPISFGVTYRTNSFSPQKGSMWSVFHRAPKFIGFFEKTEEMGMSVYFPFPQNNCCVNTA